ncbi:hypothetical protein [uncultured Lutibacter sp.]|uniref:hypothetical protein n=1 Tax=uncultured Lutibacter sp. TaxID=437739 RepID=UPI0026326423|nr:hypothetical protein [uncultured Lutibacter sp.]
MDVIKISIKLMMISMIFLLSINCSKINVENNNIDEIISLIINKNSIDFYTVPKYLHKKDEKYGVIIKEKFVIAIDSMMSPVPTSLVLNKHKQEYKKIFEKFHVINNESEINYEKIKLNHNVKILKLNKSHIIKIRNETSHKIFNAFMSFSRIAFNNNNNKALVAVSFGSHSLDVSYDLYYLKKENGIWKIFDIENISIS